MAVDKKTLSADKKTASIEALEKGRAIQKQRIADAKARAEEITLDFFEKLRTFKPENYQFTRQMHRSWVDQVEELLDVVRFIKNPNKVNK